MPEMHALYFTFESRGLDPEKFEVVTFTGREALSETYEFALDLTSADPEIDGNQVVGRAATIRISSFESGGAMVDQYLFQGIVCRFEQRDRGPEFTHYHVRLVPRLHWLSLTRQSRVFQNLSVREIVEKVLAEAGLARGDDFQLKVTGAHPPLEYTVQYQETDLDFIRRLMEHEGVFFFFEHGESAEKLIIGDGSPAHPPVPDPREIPFRDARATSPAGEAVGSFGFRQEILPRQVHLKDYNYRKPSLEMVGQANGSSNGLGSLKSYGDHFKTPDEGDRLAKLRSEEIKCRETVFFGESACRNLRSGHTFTLQDHYREANNIRYLITEVTHIGRQVGVLGTAYGGDAETPSYTNQFQAIPAAVTFRPGRTTPRPSIHGLMNARVDAPGSGEYAEIDPEGRYKIKLPYDLSDLKDGKASRVMRMAQPYAGAEYGFHFPLHKGTEVLLAHVDGDPDRPIIAASVPNPITMSPVTEKNHTQSVIRTASLNEILIEDLKGSERIHVYSPHSKSMIDVGSNHREPLHCPDGVTVSTEKGVSFNAGLGVAIAAGASEHDRGIDSAKGLSDDVGKKVKEVTDVVGKGGDIAKAAADRSLAALNGITADLGGLKEALNKPGLYMSAPGTASLVGKLETVVGSLGSASLVAAGPASLLSFTQALVGSLEGAAAVARKNVELFSVEEDVKVTAKKNVIVEAADLDLKMKAKKNVAVQAETEAMTLQAKKKVEMTSETEDVLIGAKQKNIVIQAAEAIEIKCGQASITLKKDGTIEVKGLDIKTSASNSLEQSGVTFKLQATGQGAVKANGVLELSAAGPTQMKGNPVMINC